LFRPAVFSVTARGNVASNGKVIFPTMERKSILLSRNSCSGILKFDEPSAGLSGNPAFPFVKNDASLLTAQLIPSPINPNPFNTPLHCAAPLQPASSSLVTRWRFTATACGADSIDYVVSQKILPRNILHNAL